MTVKSSDGRDSILSFLESRLIGPRAGREEVIEGTPLLQYMMGILFARGAEQEAVESAVAAGVDTPTAQASSGKEDDGGADDWLRLSGEALPSAVGLSFVVDANEVVRCQASAARYEPSAAGGGRRRRGDATWSRVPLAPEGGEEVELSELNTSCKVFAGLAMVSSRWRQLGSRRLVTVTLVNEQPLASTLDVKHALFQVSLRCSTTNSAMHPYPMPPKAFEGATEEAYLYRESVPFARGHGVAADWTVVDGECREAWTNFLPTADVPLATFVLPSGGKELDPRVLSVDWLSRQEGDPQALIAALEGFAEAYDDWIKREALAASEAGEHEAVALAERAAQWASRMREGIDRLSKDSDARRAFAVANRAMGAQMVLTGHMRKLAREGTGTKKVGPLPDMTAFAGREWRPFQLAFFLGVVEGLCNSKAPDRSIADVIWFPTGGGKTEAYLLVAAFELLRRRLVDAEGEGATAILSRYTLRMLTAQQFQRTSALFVALESIRRAEPTAWGEIPFRLGLWVGGGDGGLTPNRFADAKERLDEMRDEEGAPRNRFLLSSCPRCGTALFGPDRQKWGVIATESDFRLFCPSAECPFKDILPVDLVDDSLYLRPPSMLIATVDKFANLPWDDRARTFFSGVDGKGTPPSLLIQDELHLISGPLGTLDAGYEAAVEEIIVRCGAASPKIICSTATIKNAAEQVMGLYAREAAVFPSPVRRWDDAYFYRSDPSRTRRYVGVMGQGYVKPLMGLVWSAAVLLQSVKEVPLSAAELDAFWTLVAYHNSRRELGRTLTAARDEIPTRMKVVASSEAKARDILGEGVMQLSAQMPMSLDEAIRLLEVSHSGAEPALDVVPCTSIMSVGVDIDRLGLMVVNGQPKLTAEYIQATSRVGRGDTQGLVVTVFSSMKSRDRSHYEDFKGFHQNLYRFVEPTSVTPLAPPARQRTLHAALVAIIRHTTSWGANSGAATADLDGNEVKAIRHAIIERARVIDPEQGPAIAEELDEILRRWQSHQQSNFVYDRGFAGAAYETLLSVYGGADRSGLPTMRSLRHVDVEVEVRTILPRGAA